MYSLFLTQSAEQVLVGFYREGQTQVTERIEQKKVIQEFEDQR